MQLPEDCARNPWCSEALNVTQLTLMRAFRACGVEHVTGFSLPGSSARRNPQSIKRSKRSKLEPDIEIWELPFVTVGLLQPFTQIFSCLLHMLLARRPDAILVSNPITRIAVPAMIVARIWRVPIVIIASDLTPVISASNPLRRVQQTLQLNVARYAPG
ncbi:MAG TPA: hypothetical protein VHP83_23480, partial [Aggregatilineaceae bacterium]|nr:hypothetical protein [Aggregatilineaceae bacterium]